MQKVRSTFKKIFDKDEKEEVIPLTKEESLDELKQRFNEEIKKGDYDVDMADVDELVDKDFTRFLISKNYDIEDTLSVLLESLVWRKQKNVRYITVNEVRNELLKEKIHVYGYDMQNRLVAGISVKNHFPQECNKIIVEKLLLFFAERAKQLLHPENETSCMIFDLTDFGLTNMDYDIIKFMIKNFYRILSRDPRDYVSCKFALVF